MVKRKTILIIFMFLNLSVKAQYIPGSPYLQNPALSIGYVDSCAGFWIQTYDHVNGGFYTNIDKYGNVLTSWGTNKNMLTQSRNVYGMVRGYMLTGDTAYLNLAGKALEWMYSHAWDTTYGGWFQELNSNGNPINPFGAKTAFYAHYALLGITAYYEATRDTAAWNWLMKGYRLLEDYYWDNRESYKGYFDQVAYNNTNPVNKSFNATVDAVTTHLIYLYLFTKEDQYRDRLLEMAEEMKLYLAGSMPQQAIGFVEHFDSDWNWRNNETMTLMGHVLKTAWCLVRINRLFPDTSYINTAETLVNDVWQKGYDHVYGGPYKDFNRLTGEMLLWGLGDSAKAWWQMEQAILAGLQLYDVTGKSQYLEMADETMNFYMTYFVDHQYGEVYADRKRRGGYAWNEAKGSSGKGAYHSTELGYYNYLYGNLFLLNQPVTLNYYFFPSDSGREILLTPVAINNEQLSITGVLYNDQLYTNFNPAERTLSIPQNLGGNFKVTFAPVISSTHSDDYAIQSFELHQNYPNPFNPSTQISYSIPVRSSVKIKIFDVLGSEVAELVNEVKEAGEHKIYFNGGALSSGIYFYRIEAGSENNVYQQTRKMVLVK
jgi:mannose/cellobiose epimerase-like protein (N-acyl-D-glucosamine 2-epimerase family)